jgi:hypothetical protein
MNPSPEESGGSSVDEGATNGMLPHDVMPEVKLPLDSSKRSNGFTAEDSESQHTLDEATTLRANGSSLKQLIRPEATDETSQLEDSLPTTPIQTRSESPGASVSTLDRPPSIQVRHIVWHCTELIS